MDRTDTLTRTLRSLDAADARVDATGPRALADLRAIVASDPTVAGRPEPARWSRSTRRVLLAGGAAAALATALVTMPPMTGGDEAFATWTPVPAEVAAEQRPAAAQECRRNLADGAGDDYADPLADAHVAIAESRGVWTTVMLAGPDGFSALCITDDSAGIFRDGMIGSIGFPTGYTDVGERELFATDLGVGHMSGQRLSMAAGHAGVEVTGVAYRSNDHGEVAATVSRGRFALWLPGEEFTGAARDGLEVEVTYRDGTTATTVLTLD
ncbi:hypothetical protein [Pseudactinotalea sp. Z1748]|uniref:hypothetical protein n=1 Tax=Pseudactinotalea sp. Z1748 TaxID=3413027 RepID=UPI003C7A1D49